jgi:hypothetical protein
MLEPLAGTTAWAMLRLCPQRRTSVPYVILLRELRSKRPQASDRPSMLRNEGVVGRIWTDAPLCRYLKSR